MTKKQTRPTDNPSRGMQDDANQQLSESEREQQALQRKAEGLIGDTGENRNLTGSTTWETLPDQSKSTERSTKNKH